MKLIHGRQTLKGVFTYNDDYEEADQFIDVDFELDLAFTENGFSGMSSDSELF